MDILSFVILGSVLGLVAWFIKKIPNPLTLHNRQKTYYIYATVSAADPKDLYGTPQSPTDFSYIINSRPSSLGKKISSLIDPDEQTILVRKIQIL